MQHPLLGVRWERREHGERAPSASFGNHAELVAEHDEVEPAEAAPDELLGQATRRR
jgi:hypothetical protein